MWTYRVYDADGNELGEATSAQLVRPDDPTLGKQGWAARLLRRIVHRMNPLRRLIESVGVKPKTRKKRLPILSSTIARVRRRR